jgi:hypothetical protein
MMVIGRARSIYAGRSGFSRFAALKKGDQVGEVLSILGRLRYGSLTEEDLTRNEGLYHPLHEAFALWQGYSFSPESRPAAASRRLLARAAALDPENLLYPLSIIHLFLKERNDAAAERSLSDLLSQYNTPVDLHHPVLKALLHKYPGLGYSRQAHFDEYKRAASNGFHNLGIIAQFLSRDCKI